MSLFANVPSLSVFQFSVVDNMFSFTVAAMGAAALFFFLSWTKLGAKYQPAVMISGLVVGIACYHYSQIRLSWQGAYAFNSDLSLYLPSGKSFNDFYRYADWILTVPLLLVELVLVMSLPTGKSGPMLTKLIVAAALMIGLGYPGEVITSPDRFWERVAWGAASSVPFLYILYVLWVELTRSLGTQPANVRRLIEVSRLVIVITWAFYPVSYFLGGTPEALAAKSGAGGDAAGVVALQIGYAIADITAKAGFGLLIYSIARLKSEDELKMPDLQNQRAAEPLLAR